MVYIFNTHCVRMIIRQIFKPCWRQSHFISPPRFWKHKCMWVQCWPTEVRTVVKTCVWHEGGWPEIWYDRRQRHKGLATEGSRPNTTALRPTQSSTHDEAGAATPSRPRPLRTVRMEHMMSGNSLGRVEKDIIVTKGKEEWRVWMGDITTRQGYWDKTLW